MIFLIKCVGLIFIIGISMFFSSNYLNEGLTTEEEAFNQFLKNFQNIKKQTEDLTNKTVADRDIFGNKNGDNWSFWEEHPSITKAIDNSQHSYLNRVENQLKNKTTTNFKKMADSMIVLREYYKYMKSINIKSLEIKKSNSKNRKKIFMDEFDDILKALKKVGADK